MGLFLEQEAAVSLNTMLSSRGYCCSIGHDGPVAAMAAGWQLQAGCCTAACFLLLDSLWSPAVGLPGAKVFSRFSCFAGVGLCYSCHLSRDTVLSTKVGL